MKKTFLLFVSFLSVILADAQTLNVVVGDVTYAVPASQAGDMIYSEGTSLTIINKTFALEDITRMYIDDTAVTDNSVTVDYNGTSASVVVAGNIAQYITPVISGAHVSIVQSADVGDTTCGEITYTLSGTSDNGSFYMEGSYKATVELNGLTLTNQEGAPLNIQNGKRIDVSVKKGTENTLTDCSDGTQKGCIVCKGHIELKGKGTLNVYGNTSHAVYAKEYIEMKNCTVNVLSAVKDGFNCNQYFLMESGELNISGTGDDGIQVSFKDDTDREEEDTGSITVSGGAITAVITATASKGIKADGDIFITGGTIDVSTSGGGKWDTDDVKTKASACISADGKVQIDGGTLTLASTGSGGKGISCDGDLFINGGDMNVSTSGGIFAYVNGKEYSNYTGNTDNLASDYKSSPKGLKSDGNVTIGGGNIYVKTTGNGGEGIESKAVMTINDGIIEVDACDDALNASTDITINGGRIYAYSSSNDGIDSNGTLNIAGGLVIASGTNAPEEGFDCDQSNNFKITGGIVIGTGGSAVSPSSASSQRTVIYSNISATQGKKLCILNSNGTPIMTYELPRTMNGMALLFSSPDLVAGSYTVSSGGEVSGYTDSWCGWYDGGTWSGGTQLGTFTSNNTVTTVGGNGPGGGPGGNGGGPGGNGGGPGGNMW